MGAVDLGLAGFRVHRQRQSALELWPDIAVCSELRQRAHPLVNQKTAT